MNRSGRGEHLETGGHKAENNSKANFLHVENITTDVRAGERQRPGAVSGTGPSNWWRGQDLNL